MKKLSLSQTMYAYIIGIDVSKESLDVCMIDTTSGEYESKLLTNTKEGYLSMKRWMKRLGNDVESQSLFCMEPVCRQAYWDLYQKLSEVSA